mgnify:FL=1
MIIFLVLYACLIELFTLVVAVLPTWSMGASGAISVFLTVVAIFGEDPKIEYMKAYASMYRPPGSRLRPISEPTLVEQDRKSVV